MNSKKDLSIAIDSSLSYCSITVFKNKKILWNKEKQCNYGHEKYLSLMLDKMVKELSVSYKSFGCLHLNYGPARFTCLRNCHSLMKGFFIQHSIKIYAYTIFEHYFLGTNNLLYKKLGCLLDTNRRDIGFQVMNNKGRPIGNFKTLLIDRDLINYISSCDYIIGNGVKRIRDLENFEVISDKCKEPIELKSKYLVNDFFQKKPLKKLPKILYPYSPI